MRLRLLIKDEDYRKALIETIGRADKDIYVEVVSDGYLDDLGDDTIILTDINPDSIDITALSDYRYRVVFLTADPGDALMPDKKDGCQCLFKYGSISNILSDIEQINYMWTGKADNSYGLVSRVYAVCSDLSDKSSLYAKALARQILFRKGGRILMLSLKYVNDYASHNESNNNRFSRLLYYMDINKDYPSDAFTYSDSYGINYLRLAPGINPLSYMQTDELVELVRRLSFRKFDTVILDVGNCYSEANIQMINKADNLMWVNHQSGLINISEVLFQNAGDERIREITVTANNCDIEPIIDDYVRKIYGIEDDDDETKDSSK